MPKIEQSQLRQEDKLVLRNSQNYEVLNVIFPNGIQVGVGEANYNKGIKLPSSPSIPEDTNLRLYVIDNVLYFNGAVIGSGGGGGTPGGSDTQVQFNDGGSFGGESELTYAKSTELLTVTSGSFTFVGIGTTTPKTPLSVVHDYVSPTFEHQLSDNEGGGEILKYGSGTTAAGKLYYLHTDGTWTEVDANAAASGGSQLVGIALGTNPTSDGILLKGFARIASGFINGTAQRGLPAYVSATATGEYDFTAPSGTNDFIRIVGYCIDTDSGDVLLYFSPDSTWVERS